MGGETGRTREVGRGSGSSSRHSVRSDLACADGTTVADGVVARLSSGYNADVTMFRLHHPV